jgi:hypothetical protein
MPSSRLCPFHAKPLRCFSSEAPKWKRCAQRLLDAFDHADELVAAVPVAAGEADQFPGSGHHGALGRCAGDADPTAPPKLKETLVAKNAKRSENGVLIHLKNGRQILGRRQAFARSDLPLGKSPPNLSGNLLMELDPFPPVQLDIQHGASHTSFIETQDRPAEVNTQAELDALIEEARQRARRRRFGFAALALAAAALALFGLTQFDGGDRSGSGTTENADGGGKPAAGVRANSLTGDELCLKMPFLQIAGGVSLAAIDQAREGSGLAIDRDKKHLAHGFQAFSDSLRADLRGAERVAGEAAGPTLAAAQAALSKVESTPRTLLDEKQLGGLFAEAQTRAERAGLSNPNCWPPPGA